MEQPSVLIAIDLPIDASQLDPISSMLRSKRWRVDLLHVSPPEVAPTDLIRQDVDDVAAAVRHEGVDVSARMISGPTVEVILRSAAAWQSEFIVIVGRRHQLDRRTVLGSVASALLKTSDRPVMVLPDPADTGPTTAGGGAGPGLGAATDRLLEVLDRSNSDGDFDDLRDAVQSQRDEPTSVDRRSTLGRRMQQTLEKFELEHPSLTSAINDVAYYLSGIGL